MKFAFTKSQWERISEIISNLGIVSVVAFIIPYFSGESDIFKMISGVVLSCGLWYISLVAARRY